MAQGRVPSPDSQPIKDATVLLIELNLRDSINSPPTFALPKHLLFQFCVP